MSNNKPLFLRIEEAKVELASAINRQRSENSIPFYILEMILKDLYGQVVNGKNAELEAVRKEYEAMKERANDDGLGTREEIN